MNTDGTGLSEEVRRRRWTPYGRTETVMEEGHTKSSDVGCTIVTRQMTGGEDRVDTRRSLPGPCTTYRLLEPWSTGKSKRGRGRERGPERRYVQDRKVVRTSPENGMPFRPRSLRPDRRPLDPLLSHTFILPGSVVCSLGNGNEFQS